MTIDPARLDLLIYYVNERHRIYLKKEAGEPAPWTDDPILANNKFTNIKRELDRTTTVFRDMYLKNYDGDDKILLQNAGIARYFGSSEFIQSLGWQSQWKPKRIKDFAMDRLGNGQVVFTDAYVITNSGIKQPKPIVVVDYWLKGLWRASEDILQAFANTGTWQATVEALMTVQGFGGTGFMAKEVILDMMMTPAMKKVKDKNTWTPCGPGGKKGLRLIHGQSVQHGTNLKNYWKKSEILPAILDIRKQVNSRREEHVPKLTAHDIQFCLCEIAKYIRAQELNDKAGRGRRVRRYEAQKFKQRRFF